MNYGFTLPNYELTGKVAIITRSTRGIGNAIARTMAPLRRRGGHHRPQEGRSATPSPPRSRPRAARPWAATDVTSAEARRT